MSAFEKEQYITHPRQFNLLQAQTLTEGSETMLSAEQLAHLIAAATWVISSKITLYSKKLSSSVYYYCRLLSSGCISAAQPLRRLAACELKEEPPWCLKECSNRRYACVALWSSTPFSQLVVGLRLSWLGTSNGCSPLNGATRYLQ